MILVCYSISVKEPIKTTKALVKKAVLPTDAWTVFLLHVKPNC